MEYKGYIGYFTFDEDRELFSGKVSNIKDIIIFQGKFLDKLRSSFHDAVNNYLSWCHKNGKSPEMSSNDNLEIVDDLDSA